MMTVSKFLAKPSGRSFTMLSTTCFFVPFLLSLHRTRLTGVPAPFGCVSIAVTTILNSRSSSRVRVLVAMEKISANSSVVMAVLWATKSEIVSATDSTLFFVMNNFETSTVPKYVATIKGAIIANSIAAVPSLFLKKLVNLFDIF